jgi:hypothetical protein
MCFSNSLVSWVWFQQRFIRRKYTERVESTLNAVINRCAVYICEEDHNGPIKLRSKQTSSRASALRYVLLCTAETQRCPSVPHITTP